MRRLIWKVIGSVYLAAGSVSCNAADRASSLATKDGIVEALRGAVQPLAGESKDYDALMEHIGDARVVMLGEATHGTHEFYRERMRITQRLIKEKAFSAIVIEGDWPDAYRVNQYVRGQGRDATAEQALSGD